MLFLCALVGGGAMLLTGLIPDYPAFAGMAPPERGASYAPAAERTNPALSARPRPVEPTPPLAAAQQLIAKAGPAANAALDRNHGFIELYGGYQFITGRTVLEDTDPRYTVVRLSDGSLNFVNPDPVDVAPHAKALLRLESQLEKREIPLLYVQAPQKLAPDDTRLPQGVEDRSNDYADDLLAYLDGQKLDTLDLRTTLLESGVDWASLFFRTDHHWTPEAAFLANRALCDRLRKDYGFSIPARHTDPAFFRTQTYSDWFLGSQGKRVGTAFAGTDDISLITPSYYTDFTYAVPTYDMERTGSFDRALLFPERVSQKDYYGGNPYTLYAGGDYPLARIYNHTNPEGQRVLLLRDSFACALTPFLAQGCGELITVDLRYFNGVLMNYVDWLKPDLVICMYSAGSVALDPLFDFFRQPGAKPFYREAYRNAAPAVVRSRP